MPVKVRAGAGGILTLTVTDLIPLLILTEFQHSNLYVLAAVKFPVDSVPPVAVFQPVQSPVAQQEVALVGVQVSVEAVL